MVLHGVLGHEQSLRDLAVRPTLSNEQQDLALPRAQRVRRELLAPGLGYSRIPDQWVSAEANIGSPGHSSLADPQRPSADVNAVEQAPE